MFREFNSNELKEWNSLSEEQQKQAITECYVDIAVNIEIRIERSQKVLEEHKYYQATKYSNLIYNIDISSINNQEITLSWEHFKDKDNDKNNSISIKIGEEKAIEVGYSPFTRVYRIKISDIKYGVVREL